MPTLAYLFSSVIPVLQALILIPNACAVAIATRACVILCRYLTVFCIYNGCVFVRYVVFFFLTSVQVNRQKSSSFRLIRFFFSMLFNEQIN